jgi:hypothetical protein
MFCYHFDVSYFFSLLDFIYFSKDGEEIERNKNEERVGKNKRGKSLSDSAQLYSVFVVSVCYL